MTYINKIQARASDSFSVDSFGRWRVSNPFTIFDSKQLYDKQPLFWDEALGGSATSNHSTIDASTTMSITASDADYAVRQTKMKFNYQPAKSQLIFITGLFTSETNVLKRVGIFSGNAAASTTLTNGIYFENNSGVLSWNIVKNGTSTTVTQDDWNVDKLDGNGTSGYTLDISKVQILIIDFEWLGVGRCRAGFVINGNIIYVHQFLNANYSTSVYMSTPNLPIRFELTNNGAAAGSMVHICSSVISEGGVDENGVIRTFDNGITGVATGDNSDAHALLGIRLKSTYPGTTIIPTNMSIICTSNSPFRWSLLLSPTVADTFTYSSLTNSSVEAATGVTANVVTNGLLINSGYSVANEAFFNVKTSLRLGSTIGGTQDTLVLAVNRLSNQNETFYGSLTWREL